MDTRENSFFVCVNLIIQIFIYTVRKNLLIFISSQAPRGPTTDTHQASTHPVQVQGSIAAPAFTQGNRKGKAGQVGINVLFWTLATPLSSPAGAQIEFGRCFFSHPFPTLATLRPHQLSCLGSV